MCQLNYKGANFNMSQGKQRSKSQIIGDRAVGILKNLFPTEWVIREYSPDYGIDLAVELFEEYNNYYMTTGEHVYFQVKGTEKLDKGKLKIYERMNVEKSYIEKDFYKEIDVVKFHIDTALLGTVEKMGSAVPVLLTIVDITNNTVYFVCLNDYIEKIIIPTNPDYILQDKLLINIPISNAIKCSEDCVPIRWYAKRAKLFALFSKVNYQNHELEYFSDETLITDILHFAKIIRRFDAWSASKYFFPLKDVQNELDYFLKNGTTPMAGQAIKKFKEWGEDVDEECWETNHCFHKEFSLVESQNAMQLRTLWARICNCGFILEDLAKEWFLPTFAGLITQ